MTLLFSVYRDLAAPLFSKLLEELIGTMHTIVEILSIRRKNGGRLEREGGRRGREREKGRECTFDLWLCVCMHMHMYVYTHELNRDGEPV